ncbi:unnamed protein product, partial [Oikopleura dioica]
NLGKINMSKIKELVEFHPTSAIICVSEVYCETDLLSDRVAWPDGYTIYASDPSPVGELSFTMIIVKNNLQVTGQVQGLHQNCAIHIKLPEVELTVGCFYHFNQTKYNGYVSKFNATEEVFFDDLERIEAAAKDHAIIGGDLNMDCTSPRGGERVKVTRFGNILSNFVNQVDFITHRRGNCQDTSIDTVWTKGVTVTESKPLNHDRLLRSDGHVGIMICMKIMCPGDVKRRLWRRRARADPDEVYKESVKLFVESAEIEEYDKKQEFDWLTWSTNSMDKMLEKTRPLSVQIIEENPYKVPRRKDTSEYLRLLICLDSQLSKIEVLEEAKDLKVTADSRKKLSWAINKVRLVFGKLRIRDQRIFYAKKFNDLDVENIDGWRAFDRRIKGSNVRQVETSPDETGEILLKMQMSTAPPEPDSDSENDENLPENEKFTLGNFRINRQDICETLMGALSRTKKTSNDLQGVNRNFLELSCTGLLEKMVLFVAKLAFEKGSYFNIWRINKITALLKANLKLRPITSAAFLAALLEKMITYGFQEFLLFKGLVFECQFGFRSGSSCGLATYCLEKSMNSMAVKVSSKGKLEAGKAVGVVSTDAMNAFGIVRFKPLVRKLKGVMKGTALTWFQNFLEGRKFKVSMRGFESRIFELPPWGLPQGGAASPCLYAFYTKDIFKQNHEIINSVLNRRADEETPTGSGLRQRNIRSSCELAGNDGGGVTLTGGKQPLTCCLTGGWLGREFNSCSGSTPLESGCVNGHVIAQSLNLAYADDCVSVINANDAADLESQLEAQAENCMANLKKLGIPVCPAKSTALVFGEQTSSIRINVGGAVIKPSKQIKYLGIIVNVDEKKNKLAYTDHYRILKAKLRRKAEQLSEVGRFLPGEVNALMCRGILSGICLHGLDYIGRPSSADMRTIQNIIKRALERRGAEKFWQRELRLKQEKEGVREKRVTKSVLAESPWRLESEVGLEVLDNYKQPTINRQIAKQSLNAIYKAFRVRSAETAWEGLKGCVKFKFVGKGKLYTMPNIFEYEGLQKKFENRNKYLPGRHPQYWLKSESLEFSAAKAKANHVRMMAESGAIEIVLQKPSHKLRNYAIDSKQWPFHSFSDFNELPRGDRALLVSERFSEGIKMFMNRCHVHYDNSSWCSACVQPNIYRYKEERFGRLMSKKYRWAGNTYVNRSKTLFEEKLVKINKLKEFELEISEAFEPNVAARQQRVMATLTVRGRLKEKWDLKILLTKVRKIVRGPCVTLDDRNWGRVIAGGTGEWVKWNAEVRKLILKDKFGPDNFPMSIILREQRYIMLKRLTAPTMAMSRLLLDCKSGEYFLLVKGAEFTEAFYERFGDYAVLPTVTLDKPFVRNGSDPVKAHDILHLAARYALAFPSTFEGADEVLTWAGLSGSVTNGGSDLGSRMVRHPEVLKGDAVWRLTLVKSMPGSAGMLSHADELVPEWSSHLLEQDPSTGFGNDWRLAPADVKYHDYLYWSKDAWNVMKVASTLIISKARLVLARNLVRIFVLNGPADLLVKTVEKTFAQQSQLSGMINNAPNVLSRVLQMLRASEDLDDSQLRARMQRAVTAITLEFSLPSKSEEEALLEIISDQIEAKKLQMVLQALDAEGSDEGALDELADIISRRFWSGDVGASGLVDAKEVMWRLTKVLGIGMKTFEGLDGLLTRLSGCGLFSTLQKMIGHTLGQGCAMCSVGPPVNEMGIRWNGSGRFFLLIDWFRLMGKQGKALTSPNVTFRGFSTRTRGKPVDLTGFSCPADGYLALRGLMAPVISGLAPGVFGTTPRKLNGRCLGRFIGRIELFNVYAYPSRKRSLQGRRLISSECLANKDDLESSDEEYEGEGNGRIDRAIRRIMREARQGDARLTRGPSTTLLKSKNTSHDNSRGMGLRQ